MPLVDTDTPQVIRAVDYRPPAYRTETVALDFHLDPEATLVTAEMVFRSEHDREAGVADLELLGDGPELVSVAIDGRKLGPDEYAATPLLLVVRTPPERFTLTVTTRVRPAHNTSMMGLYVSNGIYCTQCEAEGFRKIVYFQDRPDVMATWQVRIEADKAACPALLSNGNPTASGDLPGGRHFALWDDPFPKPAYLFALVAGDLGLLEDSYQTTSGRDVTLRIYSEHANIGQCGHAMESLKKSMKWDEDVYGLEYDLDLFMIVAVSDFNMGAMENKGLNVFNTSATLAKQETATDADFVQVERIIAHEYFHNWTGDRVTCRDWFQLTLKEGLTVFRDQQFSADMHSAPVKRIGDVVLLRESQFNEDAGPLAHPIRPDHYVEISNFYTRTVYEKGAEVIRMIHTLIGADRFRKGMDLYFQRHDGQAVTCEDFVKAMEDASGKDLALFRRWYSQAGTPEIKVDRHYDVAARTFTMEITQRTPPTAGQPEKLPLHMPIRVGLLGKGGAPMELQLLGENAPRGTDRVIELTKGRQHFTFVNVDEPPIPSLLRGFSAPVRLDAGYSEDELAFLLTYDPDEFARWDAGQNLALRLMLKLVADRQAGRKLALDPSLVAAHRALLAESATDPAFFARALVLPSDSYLAQQLPVIDVDAIWDVGRFVRRELGKALRAEWTAVYEANGPVGGFTVETAAIARRSLRNLALAYLMQAPDDAAMRAATTQFAAADNMTDSIAALRCMAEAGIPAAAAALESFYARWQDEPLVVNKWFALQAMIDDDAAVERVQALTTHPAFSMSNPNRLRSVIAVFAMSNAKGFHRADGAGYRYITDKVLELDAKNPQVAARLIASLGRWRRYDPARQAMMNAQLERIVANPHLSRDSYEIASKSLAV